MFNLYFKLLRCHHWIKNFLIFAPLIFVPLNAGFEISSWINALFAFMCFCLASSSIYIFNDLMDANRDKLDYRTSSRPIASNKISKKSGLIFSLVMLFITFLATMMLSFEIIWILLAYVLINIAYSLKLKTIVVVDVVIISSGFLLRIIAGGIAVSVEQSFWTLIIVGSSSLTLALGKRLGQLQKEKERLVAHWNKNILLISFIFSIFITLIFYILFSFDVNVILRHGNNYIWTSAIPIILIFLRHFQICYIGKYSGDPTLILFKDHLVQFLVLLWIVIISFIFIF